MRCSGLPIMGRIWAGSGGGLGGVISLPNPVPHTRFAQPDTLSIFCPVAAPSATVFDYQSIAFALTIFCIRLDQHMEAGP